MEYQNDPFSMAALDVLAPLLVRLHEVEGYLQRGEVLAARGTFIGMPEQVSELDSLLKTAVRVAKVKTTRDTLIELAKED